MPCRHHGIKCMTACGQCQGSECINAMENYDTDSSEDDYESSEDCDGKTIRLTTFQVLYK